MRKAILVITLSLLLLSSGVGVLAKKGLPSPGITPDSAFYFIDILGEKIGLFFAFSAEKKAIKALKYADEKLAEIIEMAEEENEEALEKANDKYQEYMDLANEKAEELKKKDTEELMGLIVEKTLEHQKVLLEVLEDVDEEEIKKEIEEIIEATKEGFEKAFEELPEDEQEEWKEEIKVLENEEVEKVVKGFLESLIAGDYDKAFSYIVNEDGSLPSEKNKQDFEKEIKKKPVIGYSITQITDFELHENLAKVGFTKVKVVEFIVIFGEGQGEVNGGFPVGYISGEWKLLLGEPIAQTGQQQQPQSLRKWIEDF